MRNLVTCTADCCTVNAHGMELTALCNSIIFCKEVFTHVLERYKGSSFCLSAVTYAPDTGYINVIDNRGKKYLYFTTGYRGLEIRMQEALDKILSIIDNEILPLSQL